MNPESTPLIVGLPRAGDLLNLITTHCCQLKCPWGSSEEEEEREKEEKEEERETTDPMPTLGSSQLQCRGCNSTLAESDLSSWDDLNQSPRRAGLSRLAETEDAPTCADCLNHWSL